MCSGSTFDGTDDRRPEGIGIRRTVAGGDLGGGAWERAPPQAWLAWGSKAEIRATKLADHCFSRRGHAERSSHGGLRDGDRRAG